VIFVAAVAVMLIPVVGKAPGSAILVAFFAILAAAWSGGVGPGLFVMALIVLITWPPSMPLWRLIRLVMFLASGAGISLMVGSLRNTRRRAEEASRAKDVFLAMISHELRTPLTSPLLTVSALLADPALPASMREPLEVVMRGLRMEARLVNDLLDAMHAERGGLRLQLRPMDAHDAARRAVESCFEDLRAAGLKLLVDLKASESCIEGDPERIQQVVWNLVRNAVRHAGDGGSVVVRSRNEPGPSGEPGRPHLLVEIVDAGPGLEPHELERIFQPFTRSSGRSSGLGLGLTIARSLTQAHGGQLTAWSEGRGCGSTFCVSLPTVASALPAPDSTPARDGQAWPRRILLVEDDEPTRRVLARLLRLRGSDVSTASSLAEARSAIEKGPFDLVLSDLGLPDGSGLDLIAALARERPLLAIALTGYGRDEDVRDCRNAGFAAHLTKPIDLASLEGTIRRVMTNDPP
jgi:signal transduction histidine kinase